MSTVPAAVAAPETGVSKPVVNESMVQRSWIDSHSVARNNAILNPQLVEEEKRVPSFSTERIIKVAECKTLESAQTTTMSLFKHSPRGEYKGRAR